MDDKLHKKIELRREKGTLRSLSLFEGMIDFFSNDYLGLSSFNIEIKETKSGATGSRLISGTTQRMLDVEQSMAKFFEFESGVMFNSGYDANIGFFSSVPQRGDTILYDELIHASVRDGIRLSLANGISFKHNNIQDLEKKTNAAKGTVYIAVESLYSMDGDIAPLKSIAKLSDKANAFLVVDEAHACGVFGVQGKGLTDREGVSESVFAKLVTFGKGYGSHGGLILGSDSLIEYLVNFSRSFIYTTALPESTFDRNLKLIQIKHLEQEQLKLKERISYFRSKLKVSNLLSDCLSPIQIIEIGDVKKTKDIAEGLRRSNIAAKPIFSPTVAEGSERLRICIHSFNSESEIDSLVFVINQHLMQG